MQNTVQRPKMPDCQSDPVQCAECVIQHRHQLHDNQSVSISTNEYGQLGNICCVHAFLNCNGKRNKLLYFMLQLAVEMHRKVRNPVCLVRLIFAKSPTLFKALNIHSLKRCMLTILIFPRWVTTDYRFFRPSNNSFTFSILLQDSCICHHEEYHSGDKGYVLSAFKHAVNMSNTQLSPSLP